MAGFYIKISFTFLKFPLKFLILLTLLLNAITKTSVIMLVLNRRYEMEVDLTSKYDLLFKIPKVILRLMKTL